MNISGPPREGPILRAQGAAGPKNGLCGYRKYFEAHLREITEHPGGGRREPGHGSRVDQPGPAALDVRHLLDARHMRMAAADEIPVAGAGHGGPEWQTSPPQVAASSFLDAAFKQASP